MYLAIVKGFEPLLLLPISFGMLCTNLPGADMFHEILFAGGHVHWDLFGGAPITQEFLTEMSEAGVADAVLAPWAVGSTVSLGLLDVLYLGVKLGIYPCLIFMGVGTMTDFGPLIANPKSLLLGAAAQLGIFMTYVGTQLLGFTSQRVRLHRYHRRRGRPDGDLRHDPSRSPSARPHRRCGVFLHGARSGHSAAHHEGC